MTPTTDVATDALIELRRWAVTQAQLLFAKGVSVYDLTEAAESIESWVLRDDEEDAA